MTKTYQTNSKVEWDWANGVAKGYIREVFREEISKTIKGTKVTRKASDQNPAYTIEQQDGDLVLKSHSEIRKSN